MCVTVCLQCYAPFGLNIESLFEGKCRGIKQICFDIMYQYILFGDCFGNIPCVTLTKMCVNPVQTPYDQDRDIGLMGDISQ